MASEPSRGISTYEEGDGGRENLYVSENYTDIITLQLFHLTSLSQPPSSLVKEEF